MKAPFVQPSEGHDELLVFTLKKENLVNAPGLLLILTLTFAHFAKANSPVHQITCQGKSGAISISDENSSAFVGSLYDLYNGAAMICKKFVWSQNFNDPRPELPCIGLWNWATDQKGTSIDRAVRIVFTKGPDGKISASYVRDWGGHDSINHPVLIKLPCIRQIKAEKSFN